MTTQLTQHSEQEHGSETVTQGVRVIVRPEYLPDQSTEGEPEYVFGYTVRIVNESDVPVQLVSRRWLIIDASGDEHTVEGEGVVGRQPLIQPGAGFEYSSFCPLRTLWGTMEGSYLMERDDSTTFDAQVARFYLVAHDTDDAD